MSRNQITINDVLATLVANPSEFYLSDEAMRWVVENSIPAIQEICEIIEIQARSNDQTKNTYTLVEPVRQRHPVTRVFKFSDKFTRESIPVVGIMPANNFLKYFKGIEEQVTDPPRKLKPFKLIKNGATDAEIIADMGGIERIGATLEEIYCLLKDQPEDGSGDLTKERNRQNIAYVRTKIERKESVIAITILWTASGWQISADAIGGNYYLQALWIPKREINSIICVPS